MSSHKEQTEAGDLCSQLELRDTARVSPRAAGPEAGRDLREHCHRDDGAGSAPGCGDGATASLCALRDSPQQPLSLQEGL